MCEKIPGRKVVDHKARTMEIINFSEENRDWLIPGQRIVASVLFWMDEKGVSKQELSEKLGLTESELNNHLRLDNLSIKTITKLEKITGLKLLTYLEKND